MKGEKREKWRKKKEKSSRMKYLTVILVVNILPRPPLIYQTTNRTSLNGQLGRDALISSQESVWIGNSTLQDSVLHSKIWSFIYSIYHNLSVR